LSKAVSKASKDRREILGHRDLREILGHKDHREILGHKACQVTMERLDHRVLRAV
jgi:hypothetical protein